jgi:chloramphenicol 3-O-phosphotransferase
VGRPTAAGQPLMKPESPNRARPSILVVVNAIVLLLAGPAGAGKSTLARAWCHTRLVAAHVQLDTVRDLLVQGLVDPRAVGEPGQAEQWQASVTATCALVRSFAESGIDVAVDDLMLPADAEDVWQPMLNGLSTHLVVVLPSLEEALARGRSRDKHVPVHLVTSQHDGSARWPPQRQLNTSGQTVGESVNALLERMSTTSAQWP